MKNIAILMLSFFFKKIATCKQFLKAKILLKQEDTEEGQSGDIALNNLTMNKQIFLFFMHIWIEENQ